MRRTCHSTFAKCRNRRRKERENLLALFSVLVRIFSFFSPLLASFLSEPPPPPHPPSLTSSVTKIRKDMSRFSTRFNCLFVSCLLSFFLLLVFLLLRFFCIFASLSCLHRVHDLPLVYLSVCSSSLCPSRLFFSSSSSSLFVCTQELVHTARAGGTLGDDEFPKLWMTATK